MTEQEAAQILRSVPGHEWLLTDSRLYWSPGDLEGPLCFSAQTIRRWVEEGRFPGALDFGKTGIRIPRASVLIYLASNLQGRQQKQA